MTAAASLTATGDQINTNPMLGPLQNNGGPTFTHGLLTGSPAIDAGDPNFTPPPLYDQRGPGYDRVFNGRIDIGSLEVQPVTPTPTPTATRTPTPRPTPTLRHPTATPHQRHTDRNGHTRHLPQRQRYTDNLHQPTPPPRHPGSGVEHLDPVAGSNREQRADWRIYHHRERAQDRGGARHWTIAYPFRHQ